MRPSRGAVLRNADLGDSAIHLGDRLSPTSPTLVDVRVANGIIVAIGPDVRAEEGDEVIDAKGGALLPGLHDHHLHLAALAAARSSVRVGPPEARNEAAFGAALRGAPGREGWIRAVGYHESVAGPLDRHTLDAVVSHRPVRVQHRSGAEWVLNSLACELVGLENLAHDGIERDGGAAVTGRIRGADGLLRTRWTDSPPDLAAAAADLCAKGVTGVTDATPYETVEELGLLGDPAITLRVMVTGAPAIPPNTIPQNLGVGPAKIVVADHALPDIEHLIGSFREARRNLRPVAVHCVTRVGLLLALAAWEEVGAVEGDRIEHGAVIDVESVRRVAGFGLTVVTQPNFIAERGDRYLDEVEPADIGDLYRCGSLLAGGVRVGGSTDAPFGAPDPWAAMQAAVSRSTCDGRIVGPDERIGARRAIELFLSDPAAPGGPPRRLSVGNPADLCLLQTSFADTIRDLDPVVVATLVGGRIVHQQR